MILQMRRSFAVQVAIFLMLFPGLVIFPLNISANPTGGVVVNGNVTFSGGAGTLNIHQGSNLAIIDWQDFSIGVGELTQFYQPGAGSVALNRVVTGNISNIAGALKANGGVIVINPNGIVISSEGVIDVGGMLTLSTLEMSNADFLNGGSNRFQGTRGTGIVNYGAISSTGGDVVMLGNFLQNAGSVKAPDGVVAFGAGGDIIVGQAGGAKISVLAGGAGGDVGIDNMESGVISGAATELKAHGNVYALAIKNDGLVRANGYNFKGGKLTLNAGSGGSAVNTGQLVSRNRDGSGGEISVSGQNVNIERGLVDASGGNGGVGGNIEVTGDVVTIGQEATILADGTDGGSVSVAAGSSLNVAGMVDAAGDYGDGGNVDLSAAGDVTVAATAVVDVSGVLDGGRARIGGGFQGKADDIQNSSTTSIAAGSLIIADSEMIGNGGEVIIWSDGDTTFRGEISARAGAVSGDGGFVEVSGKDALKFRGVVSTLAPNGRTGTLLLDPTNVNIVNAGVTGNPDGGTITEDDVNFALTQNHLIIHTGGAGNQVGNITVESQVRIEWGTPNSTLGTTLGGGNTNDLTLLATGDIDVLGHIISHGAGNINLFAGWDGVTGFPGGNSAIAGTSLADTLGPIDFSDLAQFGTPDAFSAVRINDSANFQAVQVGSRFGETNVMAGSLELFVPATGSDLFSHLGYRATTNQESGGAGTYGLNSASDFRQGLGAGRIDLRGTVLADHIEVEGNAGDINIALQGDLIMSGDQENDTRKYTQIGHGGNSNVRDSDLNTGGTANEIEHSLINADHSGNITIDTGLGGQGDIQMRAGRDTGYSRIGHGGLSNPAGDTTARGAGSYKGDINITLHGEGDFVARGNPSTGGWAGYVAVGHGGYRNSRINAVEGLNTGNTNVRENWFQDGTGDGSNAPEATNVYFDQNLGPLALDPDLLTPDENPLGDQGNITVIVEDGNVSFQAGASSRSSAVIGHGGHERPGNIGSFNADGTTNVGSDIRVEANSILFLNQADNDSERFVRLGHGGYQSPGNISGNIIANARDGRIRFEAGASQGPAQLGHGGQVHTWDTENRGIQGTLSGDITVNATSSITFRSGVHPESDTDRSYSQIGHGGFGWVALSGNADESIRGHNGDIRVTSGGLIDFMAGQPDQGVVLSQSHTMIGHGGFHVRGDHYGLIEVSAQSGIRFEALGGFDSRNADFSAGQSSGDRNFAQIGHGGTNFSFTGNSYQGGAQELELGGAAGTFRDSSITVTTATGDITFIAPQEYDERLTFTQGLNSGNFTDTEDPSLMSHHATNSWAMIGHGGESGSFFTNGINGDITVTASAGAINFIGSDIQQEYMTDSALAIRFRDAFDSSRAGQNWVQIGHGGHTQRGKKTGDITVTAFGDVSFSGGRGYVDYALIGHGGWDSDSQNSNGLLSMQNVQGDGDITVISQTGDITLQGGNGDAPNDIGQGSYAMIGHGGRSSSGIQDGDIVVRADAGSIYVHAGHNFQESFSLIGHGGRDSRGEAWIGNITVYAFNDISLLATESGYDQASNFAQIGHGGFDTDMQGNNDNAYALGTTVTGEINVTAETGDITLVAGVDNTSEISGGANNYFFEPGAGETTGVTQTGYNGNGGNTRHTDFGPGPDGDFGYGPDNIGGTADDDLVARADNVEQPGADGDYNTIEDNFFQVDADQSGTIEPGEIGAIGVRPESLGYMYSQRGSQQERYDHDNNVTAGTDGILLTADDPNRDFDTRIRSQSGWAQIGHGGQHNNVTIIDQDVNVTAGNDFTGTAGDFGDGRVAVGHAGLDNWGGNISRRRFVTTGNIDLTVGNDLTLTAGNGDNSSVKIGHGDYRTSNDRSTVEGGTGALGRISTFEGDIHVKVGGNALLVAGDMDTHASGNDYSRVLIGHIDADDNRAGHGNAQNNSGNTFIAVSRNNPDFSQGGSGMLTTTVNDDNPNGVVFSSADDGFRGQLRLYIPNRPQNQIATGTLFNDFIYTQPGDDPVSLQANDFRGDENLDFFEFAFDGSTPPSGDFTPEGPYNLVNGVGGFYQIYYNNVDAIVGPGGGGGEGFPAYDFGSFFFDDYFEAFERGEELYGFDGYDNGLYGAVGRGEASEDGVPPRSMIEIILDGNLGDGSTSDSESEEVEEGERLRERSSRKIGAAGLVFYSFDPGTNRYSSYRVFGAR